MALTPDQQETADLYASIPMPTRIAILNDLAQYAGLQSDPAIGHGIMLAANRFVRQAHAVARDRRRKG